MAAPTISSATMAAGGTALTVVWDQSVDWQDADRLYLVVGDGTGTPLPAHRLHDDATTPSGDTTATHVYELLGYVFSGETVTLSVPAGFVENGSAEANGAISSQAVTNSSTATQGNMLTRLKGQPIVLWAIPDKEPIDRLEEASPTYKVAVKAVDEFAGIQDVTFTFSSAVTKTGGASSTTHTVSAAEYTALKYCNGTRSFSSWYYVVEIDVGWTKGTSITVNVSVDTEDGVTHSMSSRLGARTLYRAKARSSRNIIYLAGNSGTDQNLVQADVENGGDPTKALATLGRVYNEVYDNRTLNPIDEILIREGTGDSAASYTPNQGGGYTKFSHFNAQSTAMVYIGPDEDSPPSGNIVFRNHTASTSNAIIESWQCFDGIQWELQTNGGAITEWGLGRSNSAANQTNTMFVNCDFVHGQTGSGEGTQDANPGMNKYWFLDCTVDKGGRGFQLNASTTTLPTDIILSNIALSAGGTAVTLNGVKRALLEGVVGSGMAPNASPGWAGGTHFEFIAHNHAGSAAADPGEDIIHDGCFVYNSGNGTDPFSYNYAQIAGEWQRIAIVNSGCHVLADTQQLLRVTAGSGSVGDASYTEVKNLQASNLTLATSDTNKSVGFHMSSDRVYEYILTRNLCTQDYEHGSGTWFDDIPGLVIDGIATDNDFGGNQWDPDDGAWNNVTKTAGDIATAYDIDDIATGDFQPASTSSLKTLASTSDIAIDAEGTTRASPATLGPVEATSSGSNPPTLGAGSGTGAKIGPGGRIRLGI